jgi:hypothetical protein
VFGLKGWEMRGERGEIIVVIFVWSAPTPAAASAFIMVSSVITPAATVATSATCTPSDIVTVIVTYPVCFDRCFFIVVVAGWEIRIRILGRRFS